MKTMNIKNFWRILLTMTICCVATACSDDDDNGSNDGPSITNKDLMYAKVEYSFVIGEDVPDLWDVEVRFTDEKGETSVEPLLTGNSWSKFVIWNTETVQLSSIPKKVSMTVVGKPKATPVELDPDKTYDLGKKYGINTTLLYNNGKDDGEVLAAGSTLTAKGSKLTEAVQKERVIVPESYLDIFHTYRK